MRSPSMIFLNSLRGSAGGLRNAGPSRSPRGASQAMKDVVLLVQQSSLNLSN